MKRTKIKTEITVQKRDRITVRVRSGRVFWCAQCAAEVAMLTPVEAAALVQTTARDIFRRVETGELHFLDAAGGGLLVCRASLGFA